MAHFSSHVPAMSQPRDQVEVPAETTRAEGWWHGYFDEAFVDLYEPLLPHELSRMQAEATFELLGLAPGARVLDLACGWGRHSVELADLGCDVVGLDQSATLLEHAGQLARAAKVEVELVHGDAREISWQNEFDAVLSLFSSLGYGSEEDDLRALRGAARALRPEGSFVLETMHRDSVVRDFAPRDWWWGKSGQPVWVERDFDPRTGISSEWLRWLEGGEIREKYHEIRVRTATEWEALLASAGLDVLACYGSWELEPLGAESDLLIIVAGAAS